MVTVLKNLYRIEITYTESEDEGSGYLTYVSDPCEFCANDHWKFPKGCSYGKPDEIESQSGSCKR